MWVQEPSWLLACVQQTKLQMHPRARRPYDDRLLRSAGSLAHGHVSALLAKAANAVLAHGPRVKMHPTSTIFENQLAKPVKLQRDLCASQQLWQMRPQSSREGDVLFRCPLSLQRLARPMGSRGMLTHYVLQTSNSAQLACGKCWRRLWPRTAPRSS